MALMPTLYPIYLQFPLLFQSLDVSKYEIKCWLVQRLPFKVADFIGLFYFEWHSQYEVGNIDIPVFWRAQNVRRC